jgi:gamma-glutamyltranspeptidase/glutathione hydrolase
VDAIVAAALTAGVVSFSQCGIGGYGGHMVIASADGRKITAIDYNSAAPAAARPDMFPLDDKGQVKGRINEHGWKAAGVPGTLAGMQLALDRYGTWPLRKAIAPALRYAAEGFPLSSHLGAAIRTARKNLARDPAAARLVLPKGEPLKTGTPFRNPDLARLLQTLADQNSVEPFYRGEIGRQIAGAFQQNGGLVTAEDMAAYHAREVEPLKLTWKGHTIYTAPLTAGGLTILEALSILKELGWDALPASDPKTTQTELEALRLAWDDRLHFLGDPEKAKVDWKRLLSGSHIRELAKRATQAVREGKPVDAETDGRPTGGTIHLSAVDSHGMIVALTLTHGSSFGSQVVVDGLGIFLGHGMSRFNPHPEHPNAPGPRKRPLHNMCPTVVLRGGKPVLGLGGAGGRRIPNANFHVLALSVGRGASLAEAVGGPRLHTEGGLEVTLEPQWPEADAEFLKKVGYQVKRGSSALVNAVAFDPANGYCLAASRGASVGKLRLFPRFATSPQRKQGLIFNPCLRCGLLKHFIAR